MKGLKNKKGLLLIILLVLVCPLSQAQQLQYALKPSYTYWRISNYSEDLAKVEVGSDSVGFITTSGKLIFKYNANYNNTGSFHDGRASVGKRIDDKMKYGFLNKKGALVIPMQYDEVENFSDNRAMVYGKDGWQAINPDGKVIFGDSMMITEMKHTDSNAYYDIEPPAVHSNRMLTRRNDKYGYTNRNGKTVIACQYDRAFDFSDDIAVVVKKKMIEVIGPHSIKWEPRFQTIAIDTAGRVLYTFSGDISPDLSDYISDGMLAIRKGRKKGFMNSKGEIIVPPVYGNNPYPLPYSDGVTIIQIRGKKSNNSDGYMMIVDTTGKTISKIPFKTKYGLMYDSNLEFHEGLLAVKILTVPNTTFGLWGYMDKQGQMVIKPQFNKALDFHDGRAIVVTQNGKLGVIRNPLRD